MKFALPKKKASSADQPIDNFLGYLVRDVLSKSIVIGYSVEEGVRQVQTSLIDITYWESCQIDNQNVFQVRAGGDKCGGINCRRLKITGSGEFSKQALQRFPAHARTYPSLCKTSDNHVFVIGGSTGEYFFKTCFSFSMENNQWE